MLTAFRSLMPSRSPKYRKAVRWLAENDPLVKAGLDASGLVQTAGCRMVAAMFDVAELSVARDIEAERDRKRAAANNRGDVLELHTGHRH